MNKNNIDYIVKNALCTACGSCSAVCQQNAIDMKTNSSGYIHADLDVNKCVDCKACTKICPSVKKNTIPVKTSKDLFGEYLKCFIGYATDDKIRQNGQSGGVTTALLCYMLEDGIIDSAIVNDFDSESRRPVVKIARDKQSILHSSGSYYAQTPVAKVVLDVAKKEKTACVALGCQTQSMDLAKKNLNVNSPFLTIGLFCVGQNSGRMIDELIDVSNVYNKEKVLSFRFKDKLFGNWPGNVSVTTNKGKHMVKKEIRNELKGVYECHRCSLCYDQANMSCDIAVGDPWGINHDNLEKGFTVIIARTKKGLDILQKAYSQNYIELEELESDKIYKGQTMDSNLTKKLILSSKFYSKNNMLYPYDREIFEVEKLGIIKDKSSIKNMDIRLNYSKELYLSNSEQSINDLISKKKRTVKTIKIIKSPYVFCKRCLRYGLKKLKLYRG